MIEVTTNNEIYFVISEHDYENKEALKLSDEYLCGVGLFNPTVEEIDPKEFKNKMKPLVIFTEDPCVMEHVREFAVVTDIKNYINVCKKNSSFF